MVMFYERFSGIGIRPKPPWVSFHSYIMQECGTFPWTAQLQFGWKLLTAVAGVEMSSVEEIQITNAEHEANRMFLSAGTSAWLRVTPHCCFLACESEMLMPCCVHVCANSCWPLLRTEFKGSNMSIKLFLAWLWCKINRFILLKILLTP